MKKFYLIYQITNNVNGKIYIGKHKTSNLDDDYFGSGKYLNLAKEKYGLENFTKTILFYCANEEEMNLLERCVVTPEFCERTDVYNINVGGDGGWDYINNCLHMNGNKMFVKNMTKEDLQKRNRKSHQSLLKHFQQDPSFKQKYGESISCSLKKKYAKDGSWWSGKHHTEESKLKMRRSRPNSSGSKNSQFGMIAIYNEETFERSMQPKDLPIPEGWAKGRFYKATPDELKRRKILVEKILKIDEHCKVSIRMKEEILEEILAKLESCSEQ